MKISASFKYPHMIPDTVLPGKWRAHSRIFFYLDFSCKHQILHTKGTVWPIQITLFKLLNKLHETRVMILHTVLIIQRKDRVQKRTEKKGA